VSIRATRADARPSMRPSCALSVKPTRYSGANKEDPAAGRPGYTGGATTTERFDRGMAAPKRVHARRVH
jgi:hypothetical protein